MKKGIVLIMLIISAIGYSQDWKTNFEAVSYTHLDVYKRQALG